MADLLNRLAEELAQDAIRQSEISGDDGIVDAIAKSLADTSTTFKETFLTAVRYYQADTRARTLMPDIKSSEPIALPSPTASKPASRPTPAHEDSSPTADAPPTNQPAEESPLDIEDIPYAEAELVDDVEPSVNGGKPHVGTGRLVPKPKVASEDAENPSVEPEVTGPRKSGR